MECLPYLDTDIVKSVLIMSFFVIITLISHFDYKRILDFIVDIVTSLIVLSPDCHSEKQSGNLGQYSWFCDVIIR